MLYYYMMFAVRLTVDVVMSPVVARDDGFVLLGENGKCHDPETFSRW